MPCVCVCVRKMVLRLLFCSSIILFACHVIILYIRYAELNGAFEVWWRCVSSSMTPDCNDDVGGGQSGDDTFEDTHFYLKITLLAAWEMEALNVTVWSGS